MLATLPSIVARVIPSGVVSEGGFFLAQDNPQFLSAMYQGRVEGAWLFSDRFTAEPHAPALIYPLYLALGHLAGALGISDRDMYDLASLAARLVLWLAVAAVAARLLRARERPWAYALAASAGGFLLSVAVVMFDGSWAPGASSYLPPSANLLFVMQAPPHWMLALAATLWIVMVLCSPTIHGWERVLVLGLGTVSLGLVFPFLLPVVGSAALVTRLFVAIHDRRFGSLVADLLAVAVPAAPFVIYNGLLLTFDPFWSTIYGPVQNHMPSPPPWFLPVFLGVVSIPGLWGLVGAWRSGRRELQLLALVALVMLAWMYVPVNFQRRAGLALPVILALLGAWALAAPWMDRLRIVRVGLVALGLLETVLVLGLMALAATGTGPWPAHALPREQFELVEWLAPRVGPNDVVLAPRTFSAFLGSRVAGRVSSSDAGSSTRDSQQKQGWVAEYFSPTTSREDRRFLERRLGDPVWLVAPITIVVDDPAWVRTTSRDDLVVYFRPRNP